MKKFFKTIWYKLQLWDCVWSVPLSAFTFTIVGIILQRIFGESIGFYDPSFLQAAFISSFVLIVFNAVAFLGINFNFRHIFRYWKTGAKTDFNDLKGWQRILLLLFLYVFYISILVILTKMFI